MGNDPMLPRSFRIVAKKDKRPDCVMLTVRPADGSACDVFAPGQFYMLYVFGHGEVPVSVSGDPAEADCLLFTVKEVGSVTSALCGLEEGGMLGLRGPFGSSWPLEAACGHDVILMAGGLGLAPLRPVILRLLAGRESYGRVSLLYGARAPERILFSGDIERWKEKIDVRISVDTAGPGWTGPVGPVTALVPDMEINAASTVAMVCGPEIMMKSAAAALRKKGLPACNIHLSMERNMKCAIAQCGRCQYGPYFVCKDGPVFSFDRVERLLQVAEA